MYSRGMRVGFEKSKLFSTCCGSGSFRQDLVIILRVQFLSKDVKKYCTLPPDVTS
jgi:hypothetical protein